MTKPLPKITELPPRPVKVAQRWLSVNPDVKEYCHRLRKAALALKEENRDFRAELVRVVKTYGAEIEALKKP